MSTHWIKYLVVGLGVGLCARVVQDLNLPQAAPSAEVSPSAKAAPAVIPVLPETSIPSAPSGLQMTGQR